MKEHISRSEFTERTGLTVPEISSSIDSIVPFKEMVKIEHLMAMPEDYFESLLRNITLEGNSAVFPYRNASIERGRIDPNMLSIGQTFVERPKYQRLIENLQGLFGNFCTTKGFAKCTAYIVIGKTVSGNTGISHYLPPLIEVHGSQLCLIDGIHRNYTIKAVGTTIESTIIKNVSVKPPCDFGPWSEIRVVDVKPPREERFRNLSTPLFRNLGWVGIDG